MSDTLAIIICLGIIVFTIHQVIYFVDRFGGEQDYSG